MDRRSERRRQRRITEARFPRLKRLADFDLAAAPTVNPATISTLASWGLPRRRGPRRAARRQRHGQEPPVDRPRPGRLRAGPPVRYATCAQLVNELAEAADERRLSRLVARYGRVDLLCLDEFGYVQLDARGSELLFQILAEREEKSSVALASNLPFSEWGGVVPDPRLVAAIVDRVTFNAHIIETGTESYRLRTTNARPGTKDVPKPAGPKPPGRGGANPA